MAIELVITDETPEAQPDARRCVTCAHWESHRKAHGDKSLCLSKRLDDRAAPAGAYTLAEERDGSTSFLVTGPEFGCVHHTPKAPA